MTPYLWACPECGHRFVTRNMWHSCSDYTLDHHFARSLPAARATFDAFIEAIRACGEVTDSAEDAHRDPGTGTLRRLPGAKQMGAGQFWLTRRVEHRRLRRIDELGPGSYGHQFRLDAPADVDDALRSLIAESYRVGLREHLRRLPGYVGIKTP